MAERYGMLTPTEVADALDATSDWIIEHGWLQGDSGWPQGPNCVVGALAWANLHVDGHTQIMRALCGHLGISLPALATWNDTAESEDIIHDGLRDAAKALREQDGQRD